MTMSSIGGDAFHIAAMHRVRPTLNQRPDLLLIVIHDFVPSRLPLSGGPFCTKSRPP